MPVKRSKFYLLAVMFLQKILMKDLRFSTEYLLFCLFLINLQKINLESISVNNYINKNESIHGIKSNQEIKKETLS